MKSNQKVFKCDGCGGILYFNPESQNLKCEYCGAGLGFEKKPATSVKQEYGTSLVKIDSKDAKHIYECNSCKTKMADVSDHVSTRCVACGSKDLSEIQGDGMHPAYIIPFSISRASAGEIFKKWIGTRRFAPNNLKKMAKLQKLSGFYVPVYSFDLVAHTKYSADGVDYYTDKEGKRRSTSRRVSGNDVTPYNDYLISASSSINEDVLSGFYGYDTSKIYHYSSEYMLGFVGTDTEIEHSDAYAIMNKLVAQDEKNRIDRELRKRFDDVDFLKTDTVITNVFNSYYYAPIWANHYKYKNKDYHSYINGQTGKAYGRAPKSFWKILFFVLGILAGVGALAWLFGLFS